MSKKLSGKAIIITGATSGMGKAIAETFAGEGASLLLSGRDEERGRALEAELKNIHSDILFLPGDISSPETNEALVGRACNAFGKLDMVCANAGVLGLGPVTEVPISVWQQTLDTNLSAIFYLSKYAIPELLKTGAGNILINASIAAFKSFPNHPAYCASKAAAVALMKQMAVDYGPDIRVNAMCPGPVDTPLLRDSAKAFPKPESAVAKARDATLLNRLGQPTDIAEMALFLASDEASWITGSAFTIDGGISLV